MLNSCLSTRIIVVIIFTIVTESLTGHFVISSKSGISAAKSKCCNEANEQTEGEEENTDHSIYLSFRFHDERAAISQGLTDGGLEARLPGPGLFRLREDVRRVLACPSLFMYNCTGFLG